MREVTLAKCCVSARASEAASVTRKFLNQRSSAIFAYVAARCGASPARPVNSNIPGVCIDFSSLVLTGQFFRATRIHLAIRSSSPLLQLHFLRSRDDHGNPINTFERL